METPLPQSNPPGRHVPITVESVASILHATVGELRSALEAAGVNAATMTLETASAAWLAMNPPRARVWKNYNRSIFGNRKDF